MRPRKLRIVFGATVIAVIIVIATAGIVVDDRSNDEPPHGAASGFQPGQVVGTLPSLPLSASPKVSAKGHELGVSDNLGHLPVSALNLRLGTLRSVGVTWLRKDLEWRNVEPVQGDYDWSANDPTIAAVSHDGIKPLLVLGYAPEWAAGPGQQDCADVRCSPADTPEAIAAWRAFVGAAASHYCRAPYNVHVFEIWNEPDLNKYWQHPNPVLYTKYLTVAYAAIHAVAGCSNTVLLGGLGDSGCAECMASTDFLVGVYNSGGKGSFDAVGSHPYIAGVPTAQTWRPAELHSIMQDHGDAGKKVWATEFAYSSALGLDVQASYMKAAIAIYWRYPWAGPLLWFTFQDATGRDGFGLMDTSGSPRPVLSAFGQLAHGG